MKTWYAITNRASAKPEISIFDEIGLYGVTARMFLDDLKAIQANDVDVFVNSPGGNVMEAITIMNGMRMSGKNITMTVMGIAASAASYVLLGATKRVMPENTYQFLHKPANPFGGNATELRALADTLDKTEDSLAAIYAKRSGKSMDEIKALLAKDSFLTAQECLELGLCDEVTAAIDATAKFDTDRPDMPEHVRKIFATTNVQPPAADTPLAERIAAMANAAGLGDFAFVFALDPAISTVEVAQAAIAQAREVQALCTVAKKPDLAADLIRNRKSPVDARTEIANAMAAADEAAAIEAARKTQQPKPKPSDGLDYAAAYNKFNART